MRASSIYRYFLAALALSCLTAVAAKPALYERLGGAAGISRIVDDYVNVLGTDPRTNRAFEGTNDKRIKRVFAEQLCDLTGGPCQYQGDSMHDVHAGHRIDDREFLSGVELLREVLVRNGVALRERNELLALLAPMRRDVVQP